MTRTLRFLGTIALLTALAAAPVLRASDPEKKDKPLTDSESREIILREIREMRTDLKAEIKDARIQADLRSDALEARLRSLTERVERMEKTAVTTRSSFFQPTPVPLVNGIGAGTIVLQNSFTDFATVNLNGMAYTLFPNQRMTLPNQPTGAYTYEVSVNGFGTIRGPITRILDDNRTLLIYVNAVPFAR
jgi:hypothetical protein